MKTTEYHSTVATVGADRMTHMSLMEEPMGYVDGMNLYQAMRDNPINRVDPAGTVTLEQINAIAVQMGFTQLPNAQGDATGLIKSIQQRLGVAADGDFGAGTVAAYEAWAVKNGKQPVRLRDEKTALQVLQWIYKYWPDKNALAGSCPIQLGGILVMIHLESMDTSTKVGGRPTYFNAIGGPYGTKNLRTSAVGLGQFTEATASRAIAYDGEKSIQAVIELLFKDAQGQRAKGNFDFPNLALNRWQAWTNPKTQAIIKTQGAQIDALIQKAGGDVTRVSNADLNRILGIPTSPTANWGDFPRYPGNYA
ncbi:MAG: hypothetical protein FWD61_16975 [Phycisphaerales bacterium]|nr:hypothetical protein [Phycisphaerales bacterium]